MYLYTAPGLRRGMAKMTLRRACLWLRVLPWQRLRPRNFRRAATAGGSVSAGRPAAATGFAVAGTGNAAAVRRLRAFSIRRSRRPQQGPPPCVQDSMRLRDDAREKGATPSAPPANVKSTRRWPAACSTPSPQPRASCSNTPSEGGRPAAFPPRSSNRSKTATAKALEMRTKVCQARSQAQAAARRRRRLSDALGAPVTPIPSNIKNRPRHLRHPDRHAARHNERQRPDASPMRPATGSTASRPPAPGPICASPASTGRSARGCC